MGTWARAWGPLRGGDEERPPRVKEEGAAGWRPRDGVRPTGAQGGAMLLQVIVIVAIPAFLLAVLGILAWLWLAGIRPKDLFHH